MTLDDWFDNRGIALLALPTGGRVPLRFTEPIAEHQATRQRAGLFDFSFMGAWDFQGRKACTVLAGLQTRRLDSLAVGRIAYTLMLNDQGQVDIDATIWRLGTDHFRLFTGRRSDATRIADHLAQHGAAATDRCGSDAVVAVQGPRSAALLATVLGPEPIRTLPYFGCATLPFHDTPALLGRIGYSGELGYELVVDGALGPALWQALRQAGQTLDLGPVECGFEAGDMLRIESGYILFARELASPATPRELGLARLVNPEHGPYVGQQALQRRQDEPLQRRLAGVEFTTDPAPLGPTVHRAIVTSECPSPSLGVTIGLAWVHADVQPGDRVQTQDGRPARVRPLPFLDRQRLRPRATPDLSLAG